MHYMYSVETIWLTFCCSVSQSCPPCIFSIMILTSWAISSCCCDEFLSAQISKWTSNSLTYQPVNLLLKRTLFICYFVCLLFCLSSQATCSLVYLFTCPLVHLSTRSLVHLPCYYVFYLSCPHPEKTLHSHIQITLKSIQKPSSRATLQPTENQIVIKP